MKKLFDSSTSVLSLCRRLLLLAGIGSLAAVPPGCGRCSPPSQEKPGEPVTASPADAGAKDEEDLPFGANAFLPMIVYNQFEGEPDVQNRYPSVVHIAP